MNKSTANSQKFTLKHEKRLVFWKLSVFRWRREWDSNPYNKTAKSLESQCFFILRFTFVSLAQRMRHIQHLLFEYFQWKPGNRFSALCRGQTNRLPSLQHPLAAVDPQASCWRTIFADRDKCMGVVPAGGRYAVRSHWLYWGSKIPQILRAVLCLQAPPGAVEG